MKKKYSILLLVLIMFLSSCSIDSWSMDEETEERLIIQFVNYISSVDFNTDLKYNYSDEELFDKLVYLLNDENYDKYVMSVKGMESHADSILIYNFRMSSIYDDNVFDDGTELELQIEYTLEEEIYLILFVVDNGKSVERLQIDHYDIMLKAFNESENWICIREVCYIDETIVDYTTKYNSSDMLFEITVLTDTDSIDGTIHYYQNTDRITFIDSSNSSDWCYVDNLIECGFSSEQVSHIENSIVIINEFSIN